MAGAFAHLGVLGRSENEKRITELGIDGQVGQGQVIGVGVEILDADAGDEIGAKSTQIRAMTRPGSGSRGARSSTAWFGPGASLLGATMKSSVRLAWPVRNRSMVLELMISLTE